MITPALVYVVGLRALGARLEQVLERVRECVALNTGELQEIVVGKFSM